MKKGLRAIVAGLLSSVLIAGCSGGNNAGTESVGRQPAASASPGKTNQPSGEHSRWVTDQKETFSFVTQNSGNRHYNNDQLFWTDMEQRLNVRFEISAYPSTGWNEKVNLLFAGGDYPEIISHVDPTLRNKLAKEGVILPLNELVEQHAPNLKAYLDARPEALGEITDDEGNFYFIPGTMIVPVSVGFHMREDLLKQLNLSLPTTTDEVYDLLLKLKQAYPDSTPLTWRWGMGNGLFGWEPVFRTKNGFYMDPDTQQLEYGYTTEKYKNMLTFLNKLYADKLIDIEFSTLSDEQWIRKISDGTAFMTFDYYAPMQDYQKSMRDKQPEATWARMMNPSYNGTEPMVYRNPLLTNVGWSFTDKIHNPEVAMKAFDYYWSEEGLMITNYGWEGETFEYVNGEPEYMAHMFSQANPEGDSMFEKYGLNWKFIQLDKQFIDEAGTVYHEVAKEYESIESIPNLFLNFTDEETEVIAEKQTAIQDSATQYLEKFIRGELSVDKDWDGFVTQLQRLGLDDLKAVYGEAYNRKYK